MLMTSSHLKAELCFWRWKYFPVRDDDVITAGTADTRSDRQLFKAYTVRTLKRFVHVVNEIMPGRQWTAEVEKVRLEEISGISIPVAKIEELDGADDGGGGSGGAAAAATDDAGAGVDGTEASASAASSGSPKGSGTTSTKKKKKKAGKKKK